MQQAVAQARATLEARANGDWTGQHDLPAKPLGLETTKDLGQIEVSGDGGPAPEAHGGLKHRFEEESQGTRPKSSDFHRFSREIL